MHFSFLEYYSQDMNAYKQFSDKLALDGRYFGIIIENSIAVDKTNFIFMSMLNYLMKDESASDFENTGHKLLTMTRGDKEFAFIDFFQSGA